MNPAEPPGRAMTRRRALLLLTLLAAIAPACASSRRPAPPPPPPPEPLPAPTPEAPSRPEPLPAWPAETKPQGADPGEVAPVAEAVVVTAWCEPRALPAGGGQAQVLVRVQRKNGQRLAGVEVRLAASEGSLYSAGRVLVTDASGMTRDRLTTRQSSVVTLNAGGTRYQLVVPVGPGE
jgi:hypothetical protein